MGRPYPGPSHRGDRRRRAARCAAGKVGDVAVHRCWIDGTPDPVFFLGYWGNAGGDAQPSSPATGAAPATRRSMRRGRLPLVPGPRRRHVQERGLPHRPRGDRELPGEASGGRPTARWCPAPTRRAARSSRRSSLLAPGPRRLDRAREESIREHVKAHLAPYQCPREIEFVDALPMTTTGKVQRRVLRERERERQEAAEARIMEVMTPIKC